MGRADAHHECRPERDTRAERHTERSAGQHCTRAHLAAEVGPRARCRQEWTSRLLDERRNLLDPGQSESEPERRAEAIAVGQSCSESRGERLERSDAEVARADPDAARGHVRRSDNTAERFTESDASAGERDACAERIALRLADAFTERDACAERIAVRFAISISISIALAVRHRDTVPEPERVSARVAVSFGVSLVIARAV